MLSVVLYILGGLLRLYKTLKLVQAKEGYQWEVLLADLNFAHYCHSMLTDKSKQNNRHPNVFLLLILKSIVSATCTCWRSFLLYNKHRRRFCFNIECYDKQALQSLNLLCASGWSVYHDGCFSAVSFCSPYFPASRCSSYNTLKRMNIRLLIQINCTLIFNARSLMEF